MTINIGGITVYDQADGSLQGSTTTPVATNEVVMVRLGSIQGSSAGAEGVAFENGKIYATNVNGDTINIHAVAADGSLSNLTPISLAGLAEYKTGGVNSVAISNGTIAVAYDNVTAGNSGYVALFNAADNSLIKTIQVGVLPDQVTFTADGNKLLVANEGEAISSTNNPVGSISIIDMSSGAVNATVSNTISFDALNGSETALKAQGLALLNGQSAAADIEPEYITVSADGTRAYVTLQEVNAVAVIDLTNATADRPMSILPLGVVDRNLAGNKLDASDQDGPSAGKLLNLQNYDVVGLLQPDAIASFTVSGMTYFITANEGDSRVGTGITDSVRLSSGSYMLDATAYPNAAALKANAQLGRLNVLTNVGDTDGDGDYDQIYTLGGRSITIFRQEADGSITKVRETGGEFEAITSALGTSFNSNQSTSASSFDTRSDDKGPEPEGVAIGEINGRTYAFVGLERVGGFMVYDVTDPVNASFVGYKAQTGSDLGPEVQKFVAANNNPTGQALLISGNEISNTVTLYSIQSQSESDDTIVGGNDAESWTGRGGNDAIRGNGGNDTIDGGLGMDTLDGGIGDDLYYVDNVGDNVINEQVTGGTDTIVSRVTYSLNNRYVENLTLSGADNVKAIGNSFNNVLIGNSGNNTLSGGIGNDTLDGGLGTDILNGGEGNDLYYIDNVSDDVINESVTGGTDTILSSVMYSLNSLYVENLTLTGTDNVTATGNTLNNVLTGNSGNNTLSGGTGNDTLDGGLGLDVLNGGEGNDLYYVDNVADVINESATGGTDTILSSVYYSLYNRYVENLTLTGTGNVNAAGNSLNNVLTGNSGNNTLSGGTGNDTYVFGIGGGQDLITDVSGTADVLSILSGVTEEQLWFKKVGNNLEVSIVGTTDKVTVNNWYVGGTANQVEQIRTATGDVLASSQVQNLVAAMSSFSPPPVGTTTLDSGTYASVLGVIAANWS